MQMKYSLGTRKYMHILKCQKSAVPEVIVTEVPIYLAINLTSMNFSRFKTFTFPVLSMLTWLCKSHFEIKTYDLEQLCCFRQPPEVLSDFKESQLTYT